MESYIFQRVTTFLKGSTGLKFRQTGGGVLDLISPGATLNSPPPSNLRIYSPATTED